MPGHMDKGTKNYRNMMKRMEGIDMGGPMSEKERALLSKASDTFSPQMRTKGSGVTSDAEAKAFMTGMGAEDIPAKMDMGMDSMLDSEKESMMKMLEGIDFAPSDIREAIEALMDMGFDREAVLEILESTPNLIGAIGKPETNPRTMTEGALGALSNTPKPMMRPTSMPERLDADRTQSMDMQKTGMGT